MAINKTSQTSVGAFSELFQFTYADVIIKLLDSVDDVEKWIDSINQEDWNGGDSLYQLYKTSEGSGSRFVSGGPGANAPVLPAYNPPSYSESTVRLYPHMDIVEITGPKLMRAHDKPGMYRQIMDELVSDVKNSHKNRVGPKYWEGSLGAPGALGNNGVLCHVPGTGAVAAGAAIAVEQRETLAAGSAGGAGAYAGNTKAYMSAYAGARYLRTGMQIQIGTVTELQNNAGTSGTVETIDQAAQTFTFSANLPAGVANRLIVEGDANGNEFGNCITGLYDAINDGGTYHGINRATASPWQSFVTRNGNSLRDFNHWRITSLLMRMADLGPKDVDEMDPVIFSHNSLLQVYLQEIDPVYMQTDLKALKGHSTIAYQYGARQIPWETARSAPLNQYTIMDRSAMKRVKLGDYGWDTSTGGIFKQIPGTFAFQAYAYNEFELVCENPRCQGREEDIRVPTGLIST